MEIHVRGKGASRSEQFSRGCARSGFHIHWIEPSLRGKDGFLQPAVQRITVGEIPRVELHGKVSVPVLEAAGDQPVTTVDGFHHVLVAL